MKHLLLVLASVGILSSASISSQGIQKRKVACKTPENSNSCYWTHARLVLANGGYPNFRLWKIGTDRILGIYAGPTRYPGDEPDLGSELPAILQKYDFNKIDLFGDFEVCPLAPKKEEHMQLAPKKEEHMQPACIESAKNIVAK